MLLTWRLTASQISWLILGTASCVAALSHAAHTTRAAQQPVLAHPAVATGLASIAR
jgi:hypothetical protein